MATEPAPPPAESLAKAEADLNEFWRQMRTWNFKLGPIRLSAEFGSMRIARYFLAFHIFVGTVGGILIFTEGPAQNLGMALVVGALFGFGAMLAQAWSAQVSKERSVREKLWLEQFHELRQRRRHAIKEQAALNDHQA